jgi:hypothetical protein
MPKTSANFSVCQLIHTSAQHNWRVLKSSHSTFLCLGGLSLLACCKSYSIPNLHTYIPMCVRYICMRILQYLGRLTLIISFLEKKCKKFFLKENKEFDEIFENLSFCQNGILKINYLFIWQTLCQSDQCAIVHVFEWIHHLHSMTPRSHGLVWIHIFIVGPIPLAEVLRVCWHCTHFIGSEEGRYATKLLVVLMTHIK